MDDLKKFRGPSQNAFFKFYKKWQHILCDFLRQTMGGDGSNIRLIYIEDEQPLAFPQIVKKRMCPMRQCAPLSPTYLHMDEGKKFSPISVKSPAI